MADFQSLIQTVYDFPKKGVEFKDITPLLKKIPAAVRFCVDELMPKPNQPIDVVVGIESRGFILGPLLAQRLECGFVPVRKKEKLPGPTISVRYDLEYGEAEIEIHRDAIGPGDCVLLHDDVLATGGTAVAAIKLIESLGGRVVQCSFIIELTALAGLNKLEHYSVQSACHL
jgi:adenine phosphoribosyltransferase